MTQLQSALSKLAEQLAGTDPTLTAALAEIVATALQELIEAELSARIGAERGECTPLRTAQRDGHRPKLVSTPAGDVEVGIPELRHGSFFPTRKVDDLVKALGCATGVSKSSVSRTCKLIDDDVAVLPNRRLDHQPFVYVWLDATYLHVRGHGEVVSRAVVGRAGDEGAHDHRPQRLWIRRRRSSSSGRRSEPEFLRVNRSADCAVPAAPPAFDLRVA